MGHHHHHHHGHLEESRHGCASVVLTPAACHYPPAYAPACGYAPDPCVVQPCNVASYSSNRNAYQQQLDAAIADHRRHRRNEHLAEAGAVAAGTFSMYEAHQARVDLPHAQRHRMEAGAAGAAALGSAAYALHERHEKKQDEHFIHSFNGSYEGNRHGDHHHHHHNRHQEHHHCH